MSFFSHCYVKYLTEPCHNDIIMLADVVELDIHSSLSNQALNRSIVGWSKNLVSKRTATLEVYRGSNRQVIYQRRLGLGTGYQERRKRVPTLVPSRHSRPLNRHPARSRSATRDGLLLIRNKRCLDLGNDEKNMTI